MSKLVVCIFVVTTVRSTYLTSTMPFMHVSLFASRCKDEIVEDRQSISVFDHSTTLHALSRHMGVGKLMIYSSP